MNDDFERDFKEETQFWIEKFFKGKEIDECYFINYDIRIADKKGESNSYPVFYCKGGKKIDWESVQKNLHLENFLYDSGYGLQYFGGFITFKDCDSWLERKEYDGNEWWEFIKKPNIEYFKGRPTEALGTATENNAPSLNTTIPNPTLNNTDKPKIRKMF